MSKNATPALTVRIMRLRDDVPLPSYATSDSAGLDLTAALDAPIEIAAGARKLVPTGLRMALPRGYEGQVRPRSGLALKFGLTVLNSPGTIDADYRGEVSIILINLGQEAVKIAPGDRIAQLVIAPALQATLTVVESLDETSRGEGGFGSTGSA